MGAEKECWPFRQCSSLQLALVALRKGVLRPLLMARRSNYKPHEVRDCFCFGYYRLSRSNWCLTQRINRGRPGWSYTLGHRRAQTCPITLMIKPRPQSLACWLGPVQTPGNTAVRAFSCGQQVHFQPELISFAPDLLTHLQLALPFSLSTPPAACPAQ